MHAAKANKRELVVCGSRLPWGYQRGNLSVRDRASLAAIEGTGENLWGNKSPRKHPLVPALHPPKPDQGARSPLGGDEDLMDLQTSTAKALKGGR